MADSKDSNFASPMKNIDLPRRHSARLRANPAEVKREPEVNDCYIWKPTEKKALLEAIKKHGTSDPRKLALEVRSKSVNEIKVYLKRNMDRVRNSHYKKLAEVAEREHGASGSSEENKRHNLISTLPPIDLWKRIVGDLIQPKNRNPDYSLVLAELWKKFGEEEEELDIPKAPNFKAIYKFVEDTLMGALPADLSPINACVMDHLLQKIHEFSSGQKDIQEFVKDFKGPISVVPSSVVDQQNGEEEKNPPETVSKELQNAAKRMAADAKSDLILPVPDNVYEDYYRHQKIQENLNPMGIPPWLLQKTTDAMVEFIEKPAH